MRVFSTVLLSQLRWTNYCTKPDWRLLLAWSGWHHNTDTALCLKAASEEHILLSQKQVSFLNASGHPICRHNAPSRTLKCVKYDWGCPTKNPRVVSIQTPRYTDLSKVKQNILNVSMTFDLEDYLGLSIVFLNMDSRGQKHMEKSCYFAF